MSSTNKTANYQLSQFVGTDIPSILNDYNGDMRKIDSAIHDNSVAEGDNASAIAELQSTVSNHSSEISGLVGITNNTSSKVINIEALIPSNASVENKLATAEDSGKVKEILHIPANTYNSESAFYTALENALGGLLDLEHLSYIMVLDQDSGNEIHLYSNRYASRWSGISSRAHVTQDYFLETYGVFYANATAMPNGYIEIMKKQTTISNGNVNVTFENKKACETDIHIYKI